MRVLGFWKITFTCTFLRQYKNTNGLLTFYKNHMLGKYMVRKHLDQPKCRFHQTTMSPKWVEVWSRIFICDKTSIEATNKVGHCKWVWSNVPGYTQSIWQIMSQLYLKNELGYEISFLRMIGIQRSTTFYELFQMGVVRCAQSDLRNELLLKNEVRYEVDFYQVVRST